MCLFELWFPQGICPVVGLLGLMIVLMVTRDTKGIFQPKMGSIKNINGMDLTEAEDINKRWQEYTELYKKDLHD